MRSPNVWPGPECLRPRALVDFDIARFQRTRGLALAWEAVRERVRFSTWLLRGHAFGTAARASRARSLEGFVMTCDWYDLRCVFDRIGFSWVERPLRPLKALRLALLASPEWKALPWQSEGVGS